MLATKTLLALLLVFAFQAEVKADNSTYFVEEMGLNHAR